jgi:hypothetical protein
LALSVPSAVMPLQRHVLVDLEHPDVGLLAVETPIRLPFDPRLVEFTPEMP